MDKLRGWIGKIESTSDQVTPVPISGLSATLDRDDPFPETGNALPPLWHLLYFLPIQRQSEIGPDGIVKRGGFLPPVPLPRRMYGGTRVQFHHPLRVGESISKVSRIMDLAYKEGRSGPLVFVLVRHEISNSEGVAITEEQDVVYRGDPRPGDPVPQPKSAPRDATWSREICTDEVMLFRFSALTFNGHRIHYDWRYATAVEGYPQLLVHGSLIGTLLLDLLRRNLPSVTVTHFSSRAVTPLLNGVSFSVCGRIEDNGKTIKLWAATSEGHLATEATALLA